MSLVDKHYVFEYPQDIRTVYGKILSVSRNVRGLEFDFANDSTYTVYLKSGVTFWSWGETVSIECVYLDSTHTRVQISSVPKMPTTLVDWGKGKKNINNVLDALRLVFQ